MIDLEIKEKRDCMGCHSCANICPRHCISMTDDEEGFWYPIVDYDKCVKCHKCIDACPMINKTTVENEPTAYACLNKDESIRMESSSGGIFTLIAEQIIAECGVVLGAGFDRQFDVQHISVENGKDLGRLRGSKYVQSKIGDTYKQAKDYLRAGRKVLFSGTPCQIAGLKAFLGRAYENLTCVDIVCHGVPSPEVWRKYVEFRESEAASPAQGIVFRRKNEGWKKFSVSFSFENGTEYTANLLKDLYLKAFLKNVCLRPSCYACRFKTLNRQSDITLADFWGIQHVLPEMDDDKGTSLIFVNSRVGEAMFDKVSGKTVFERININDGVRFNSAAVKSVASNPNRERFFNDLDVVPFDKLVQKYCSDRFTVRLRRRSKAVLIFVLDKTGLLNVLKRVLTR